MSDWHGETPPQHSDVFQLASIASSRGSARDTRDARDARPTRIPQGTHGATPFPSSEQRERPGQHAWPLWPEGAERTEVEEPTGPAHVTPAGADWLASASAFPRSVHALWNLRPTAPSVLPCGTAFDIVSTSPVFGRRLLDRLWSAGPGSGPAAAHRGRALLFAAPGTAQRLPALLNWEEWRTPHGSREAAEGPGSGSESGSDGSAETIPPLLCHGIGDAVTIPALRPADPPPADTADRPASRWLVAPGVRHPWLPGPEVLLWACVRTMRSFRAVDAGGAGRTREQSIFTTPDRDAKVYDVSRRR